MEVVTSDAQTCILEAVAFGVPTSPPAQDEMERRQPEPQPRRRGDSKTKGLRPCRLTSWDNRRRPSRFRLISPGRHCKNNRNLQATDHQVDKDSNELLIVIFFGLF
ncbi:hypothetical protein JTE90_009236 [Oedothorax gibbosus]|uniref:Uncharacterized protein n=1 Tax=Oedothorax gibbosus TaxID=931172 RepID=A0AAV6UT47_9ARAC|nr:hypothetical protein JTE90_009236 [Oedothorax gibbosus]